VASSRETVQTLPGSPLRILLVEESAAEIEKIHEALRSHGLDHTYVSVSTWVQFMKEVQEFIPDVIVATVPVGGFPALEALDTVRTTNPHTPFIFLPHALGAGTVAEFMKHGADDFLTKSELIRLPEAIRGALDHHSRLRKRDDNEREIRQQRDTYEELLAVQGRAGVGCAIIRAHSHTIVFANDAFCTLSGYDLDELVALPTFFKIIAPEKAYPLEVLLRKKMTNVELMEPLQSILHCRNGDHLDVELSVRMSRTNYGNRFIVLVMDISDRVRHEVELQKALTELREREEHFRLLFDGVKDYAMFMIDPMGHVMNWNTGAERILGFKGTEVQGMHYSLFFTRDDNRKEKPHGILVKAMERNRFEEEGWWVRKDTTRFWASAILSPLRNTSGNPIGCSVVLHDLSEHKQTEDQLRRQGEDLRALARHLQSVREEERFRIARELHDELGQILTALRMELSILQRRVGKMELASIRSLLGEKITSMSQLIESTMQSVRKIVSELRPTVLDEFGLLTAIQWQAQEFENRTGIRCVVSRLQRDVEVKPGQATAVFRILQEALTNVARHAGATRVELSFELKKGELVLTVKDNGRGIDTRHPSPGKTFGLLGMEERARVLSGRIEINGRSGEGTTISVFVPYADT
jgi:PAS domain S-box-containing protein